MIGNKAAFTLIELLIVVAIIAILAAIAVPNLLEAQTRSKVSRAQADMRSMATALEAYHVDFNRYPPEWWPNGYGLPNNDIPNILRLVHMTTPVAFMTSIPSDPFNPGEDYWSQAGPAYHYCADNDPRPTSAPAGTPIWSSKPGHGIFRWVNLSYGPDRVNTGWQDFINAYDPTNGTVSDGNIMRVGP